MLKINTKHKYKTKGEKTQRQPALISCSMTLQKKNTKQRFVLRKRNLLRQIQLLFKQIFKVHLQYKILMALET